MIPKKINECERPEILTIEQPVLKNHLVRKVDAAIDFNFIYPLGEYHYTAVGRLGMDPVVLFNMTFLPYTFDIRSMHQTTKEIEMNMAYR